MSLHVPLHMKLARRCDNHGNVCFFFLAKRIGGWGPVLMVISSIELNECVSLFLLLVHLLTCSMPRTVGQTSDAG